MSQPHVIEDNYVHKANPQPQLLYTTHLQPHITFNNSFSSKFIHYCVRQIIFEFESGNRFSLLWLLLNNHWIRRSYNLLYLDST